MIQQTSDNQLLTATQQLAASLFTSAESIASAVVKALQARANAKLPLRTIELRDLSTIAREQFVLNSAVDAAGLVLERGTLDDNNAYFEWWRREDDMSGAGRTGALNIRPGDKMYQGYVENDVYKEVRNERANRINGPTLDYTVTEQFLEYAGEYHYVCTFMVPIVLERKRFIGVAAVDARVSNLEKVLWPLLREAQKPRVLINSDRRVIAASDPNQPTGSRIEPLDCYPRFWNVPNTSWIWVDTDLSPNDIDISQQS